MRCPVWPLRIAREPLTHFALIGAVLFALDHGLSSGASPPARDIVISSEVRETLRQRFVERTGREPTENEERELIAAHVGREVLYREALALGLERGDPIIRRRLIQRMEFLAEDMSRPESPTESELAAYLEAHAKRYERPATVTLEHVFWRRDPAEPERARRSATAALDSLTRGQTAGSLGDPFVHGSTFSARSRTQLGAVFGDEFAAAVMAETPGAWTGPLESAYGVHLVRVLERRDSSLPRLGEIRPAVTRDLERERAAAARAAIFARMRARYRVVAGDGGGGRDGAP